MKKFLLLTILMFSFVTMAISKNSNGISISNNCYYIVKTHMGDICVSSFKQENITMKYMGIYINYLYKNFDTQKVKFSGRRYSNMSLYSIYHYKIQKDGSITDLTPVVLSSPEFDEHVKNLILSYPPAPLLDGMPNEMKVELEITQSVCTSGTGIVGSLWGEYYNIHFIKGVKDLE